MFRRLLQWLGLSPRKNPGDRFIFHYHDGTNLRTADPVAIEQSLVDSLGEDWRERVDSLSKPPEKPVGAIGDIASDINTKREELRKDVLAAIDRAFNVHAYVGIGWPDEEGYPTTTAHGLSDSMRFGLLTGFRLFCIDLIRASRPFSNAQSRASPSSPTQATPNGADSTSTESASKTPEPTS